MEIAALEPPQPKCQELNELSNDEIVQMQVGEMNIRGNYAVVMTGVDDCIVSILRRLEQRLQPAVLRID